MDMTGEGCPASPPEPRPPARPIAARPGGLGARWLELLRENWQSCHPRFWEFRPTIRYRFSADDLRLMSDLLVSEEERRVRPARFRPVDSRYGPCLRLSEPLGE